MVFKAEVIKEETFDPNYKIRFSYENEGVCIEKGYADVVRKMPKSVVTYDEDTDKMLSSEDKLKIELELVNVVLNHLLATKFSLK